MTYKYWNSGNDVAICRVGDVTVHGISLQDFKHFDNVLFQKIYGGGKVKL
jgi:hypothetical protein